MHKFLTLTKREFVPQIGLWNLNLDCWAHDDHRWLGRLVVNSGAPGHQIFRTHAEQVTGQLEPMPEAHFTNLGPLEFASGHWGDYSDNFPAVESPIWQTIDPVRAIGLHLDGNRAYAPGSAACCVFRDMADLREYVGWHAGDPRTMTSLHAYWGLGSIKLPVTLPADPLQKPK